MRKLFAILLSFMVFFACKKPEKKVPAAAEIVIDKSYDKASSFIGKNTDSAFYYFNKMVTTAKDSFNVALGYCSMGQIQFDAGDFFGSQESVTTSLKFLKETKKEDQSIIAANNNILGRASSELKRYDEAINYFDLALRFNKNSDLVFWLNNNKALSFQGKGDYNQAILIYDQILPGLKNNPGQYARALSNITKTKWLQNPNYNAAPDLLRALAIREQEKDKWGLNASYAHLADYYLNTQPVIALKYAQKMYKVAQELESPDDQLEALQKIIKLSTSGQKDYFEIYEKLNDSLQTARNAAKNQFALVRFNAESAKAENFKLQTENTDKENQIIKRNIYLYSISILIVALAIISVLWYKKRKQRLEADARAIVHESQLKTSKKVHDVVANGLYRVMAELENQETLDKDAVLDKIESLYEKSRDISYEAPHVFDNDYPEKIASLLKSFTTTAIKINVMGNTAGLWDGVNEAIENEIEQVLQELMVNMKKHSKATSVTLLFERHNNTIQISYSDNGIGIAGQPSFKNGLTNTETRIKSINGAINFETSHNKGLEISISFPVS